MRLVHHTISHRFPSPHTWFAHCIFTDDCSRYNYCDYRSGIFYGRLEAWIDAARREPWLDLAKEKNSWYSLPSYEFGLRFCSRCFRNLCGTGNWSIAGSRFWG